MSEEKKEPKVIIIQFRGTQAELEAKQKALEEGRELLPDGTKYKEGSEVEVKIWWDKIEKEHEAFLDFYASPKQLLDLKLRPVREKDLSLPSPPGINRHEMLAAIQGGLNGVDLNFLESSLLQAIVEAFSRADYPEKIELSRSRLYELMGVEKVQAPGGRRQWLEGGAFWRTRNKYHNSLLGLGRKSYPFIFRWRTGENKKGEPLFNVALTYEPIVKVTAFYEDVKQPELPAFAADEKTRESRFSHYEISLNPAARGEVDHYFRYLPSGLSRELTEFRKGPGRRASVIEFNFIEFLYTVGQEIIEINFLKLAEKLKIKIKSFGGEPARIERRVRQILKRCYEVALGLSFALEILEDQPAARGNSKEVIRLNPERFKHLKQGQLFEGVEAKKSDSLRLKSPKC